MFGHLENGEHEEKKDECLKDIKEGLGMLVQQEEKIIAKRFENVDKRVVIMIVFNALLLS